MAASNPLLFSVHDLVRDAGGMREFELTLPAPEQYGAAVITVPESSELTVSLRLESVYEGILASGVASCEAVGECVRCLEPVTEPLRVEFQELFAYDASEAFEFGVRGDQIDLAPVIRDAVVLALPFGPLCAEDCPGLDPLSGRRLSEGAEPAAATGHDLRWDALRKLQEEK